VDEISLAGLIFFGRHGVNPEEYILGQRFGVDASYWIDLTKAINSDDLNDTVSYAAIYKLLRAIVEGQPSKLLEHLAGRMAEAVLAHDERIGRVRIRISKLSPPIKGSTTGEVAVIVSRSRDAAAS
jgi:dihydroneopterin aldolase